MRVSTAYNHRDRAQRQLADIMYAATAYRLSSTDISKRVCGVLKSIKQCPYWVQSYIDGWLSASRTHIERDHVFYYSMPYTRKNGKRRKLSEGKVCFASANSNRDDYYGKLGYSSQEVAKNAVARGFYWVRDNELPRPYWVTWITKGS